MIESYESSSWHSRQVHYINYLKEIAFTQSVVLPPEPTEDDDLLYETLPYINHARWMITCDYCGQHVWASKQILLYVCPHCTVSIWYKVVFSDNADEIEQLLNQRPRIASLAPLLNWDASQTIAQLQEENELIAAKPDNQLARSLSVGATHNWISGELLTAAQMNTFLTEILKDLIGRNGVVEIEHLFKLFGITAETLPADLPEGALYYRTDTQSLEMGKGGTESASVLFNKGDQSIEGVKSFNVPPRSLQEPTNDMDITTKQYVDSRTSNLLTGLVAGTDVLFYQQLTTFPTNIISSSMLFLGKACEILIQGISGILQLRWNAILYRFNASTENTETVSADISTALGSNPSMQMELLTTSISTVQGEVGYRLNPRVTVINQPINLSPASGGVTFRTQANSSNIPSNSVALSVQRSSIAFSHVPPSNRTLRDYYLSEWFEIRIT